MKLFLTFTVLVLIFAALLYVSTANRDFSLTADCATALPLTISADAQDTFYHVSVPDLDRTKDTVFYACTRGKATKVLITAYADVVEGIPIDVSANGLTNK